MYVNYLGKYLLLFVYSNANSTRYVPLYTPLCHGYIFELLNGTYFLDIYSVTFLIDSHVFGQRNKFMFSKIPREMEVGTSPFLCVLPFGELLEDGNTSRKRSFI